MLRSVPVRVVQHRPLLGRVAENLADHGERIARAAAEGAEVVVFSELSLTGYCLGDLVDAVALAPGDPAWEEMLALSEAADVVLGFVERGADGRLHNSAAYLHAGTALHVHRKVYLPTYGPYQEGRFFVPGDRLEAFDAPWGRAALVVCEEAWHPAVAQAAASLGAEVLFVIANGPGRGPVDGGWESVRAWREILGATARLYTTWVAFAQRVGWEEGFLFGGGSAVWAPDGARIAEAGFLDPEEIDATLEADRLRRARVANPAPAVDRPELLIDALRRAGAREP